MASTSSAAASIRKRGAFIVLEGLDRSGKSTQCLRLVDNLNSAGMQTKGIRFPGESVSYLEFLSRFIVDNVTDA